MTLFEHFPADILDIVFYKVKLVDLLAIACTCKRFRNIVHDGRLNIISRVEKRDAITWTVVERTIEKSTRKRQAHIYKSCFACGERRGGSSIDPLWQDPNCIYTCSMCKLMLCAKKIQRFRLSLTWDEFEFACEQCFVPFFCDGCRTYKSMLTHAPRQCHSCDNLGCDDCIKFGSQVQLIFTCRKCGGRNCKRCHLAFKCGKM